MQRETMFHIQNCGMCASRCAWSLQDRARPEFMLARLGELWRERTAPKDSPWRHMSWPKHDPLSLREGKRSNELNQRSKAE